MPNSLVLPRPTIPEEQKRPLQPQIEAMIAVIDADNLVHGTLVCANAGHCALGALLYATGFTNLELVTEAPEPSGFSTRAAQHLYDWFRIGEDDAYSIMAANDTFGRDHGDRPEGILKLMEVGAHTQNQPTPEELEQRRQSVKRIIEGLVRFPGDRTWPQIHGERWEQDDDETDYDYDPF